MQHHAKEKSKGAAKKGKPGWHRGRNDPKKGSQGDEEMELVGSLMKKCLNPLILPANNGGALNWVRIQGPAVILYGESACHEASQD